MNTSESWEHRLGAYAICVDDSALLVIDKLLGPYRGRYDLPGGGIEEGETPAEAVLREVREETGLEGQVLTRAGQCEFLVPWPTQHHTHLHHTATFFTITITGGQLQNPKTFPGQDSQGGHWIPLPELTTENSSPLTTQAIHWLQTSTFPTQLQHLDGWIIKPKKT